MASFPNTEVRVDRLIAEVENLTSQVKQLIETKCLIGNCSSPACHSVTVSNVKDAAKALAKGIKDETYEMNSNHFI